MFTVSCLLCVASTKGHLPDHRVPDVLEVQTRKHVLNHVENASGMTLSDSFGHCISIYLTPLGGLTYNTAR
jgi:hypothetical protein